MLRLERGACLCTAGSVQVVVGIVYRQKCSCNRYRPLFIGRRVRSSSPGVGPFAMSDHGSDTMTFKDVNAAASAKAVRGPGPFVVFCCAALLDERPETSHELLRAEGEATAMRHKLRENAYPRVWA